MEVSNQGEESDKGVSGGIGGSDDIGGVGECCTAGMVVGVYLFDWSKAGLMVLNCRSGGGSCVCLILSMSMIWGRGGG